MQFTFAPDYVEFVTEFTSSTRPAQPLSLRLRSCGFAVPAGRNPAPRQSVKTSACERTLSAAGALSRKYHCHTRRDITVAGENRGIRHRCRQTVGPRGSMARTRDADHIKCVRILSNWPMVSEQKYWMKLN